MTMRKAVIPAAGLGTRFLPATKAIPKELLPVVDKPAIQYVVEEAVEAGLTDVLMVVARGKSALEDHFDRSFELEATLEAKGKTDLLERTRYPTGLASMHYVRQGDPLGLGHAVLTAAGHVGDEPFAVLLGDDLIDTDTPLLPELVRVQEKHGGSVIALMEVPPEAIRLYGCAAVEATAEDGVVRVTGMVEKPEPSEAPSNLAMIGRYVISPAVFEVLRSTPPGRGGEIQLTDALQTLAGRGPADGGPVHGVVFRGRRYDTGDKADYLRTVVTLAARRPDLGPEFLSWLQRFVAERAESAQQRPPADPIS